VGTIGFSHRPIPFSCLAARDEYGRATRAGEPRSFPYMGNVRTVRIDPETPDFSRSVMALLQSSSHLSMYSKQICSQFFYYFQRLQLFSLAQ
jgi:hypothetical protein